MIAPGTDDTGACKLAERLAKELEETMASNAADEASPDVRVLAGYNAVPNLKVAGVRPGAILANAKMALTRLQTQPDSHGVLRYDGDWEEEGDLGDSLADVTVDPQSHVVS